ncbi:MAG: GNAT family N-acetyltransferase [Eubacteriales bacterium]
MDINYRDTNVFLEEQLRDLFLSVEWSSGQYPERLVVAMENYKTVYSAWDREKLVGMICVMDDGIMNAYVHYLLVRPDYQRMGIGRELVDMVKSKYVNYLRICLISYEQETPFYEKCGFKKSGNSVAMNITSLWT